ncbi:MAG TPA: glycine zipper 2TM domain-containing protein [Casimicrobiaceae bacterium]|nr:glycine zipper 2TM domain-containing protein [Casimicrobiaceae bacterium]
MRGLFARKPCRVSRAAALIAVLVLSACGPQPVYQVAEAPPTPRVGTVESIREQVEQAQPSGAGLVLGALAGGGLGSLVGAGTGRTVATVVGAVGGGYVGNQLEKSKTQVIYQIGIRYDDGTWATVRQSAPAGLKVGDRVRVTDNGLELVH